MKKTRAFVIAVAVALGLGGKVHAALYPQSIYIGNKGYHIDYLTSHVKELNDLLTLGNISDIYYCDESGNISSIFTGIPVDEATFNNNVALNYNNNSNITYIDEMGVRHILSFNGTNYGESGSYGYAQVQVTPMGTTGLKIVNIKLNDVSTVFPSAKYFQVEDSDTVKKILPADTTNISNTDYQITLITSASTERLSVLSTDYNVIAYGSLDISQTSSPLASIGFTATDYKEASSSNNGNLYSNINNGGLVAKNNNVDSYSTGSDKVDDRWLYYSNGADGGKLYRKNTAGIQDYKISEDSAKYINVVGDWIYYSNYSDGQKIYKVKTDGTNRRKVCDDKASYLNVGGGYIYYANQNDGGKIYKVSVDAVNLPSSSTSKVSSDSAQFLNLSGDVIYYSNRSDKNKLYSIHTDGGYRAKISDDNANYITLTDSDVYYTTDQNKLYRIDKQGQGTPQWINIKVDITDKKGVTTTSNDKISSFNIIGDNIYYISNLDGRKLYVAPGLSNYTIKASKYANEASIDLVNVINDNGNDLVYYSSASKLYVATDKPLESVDAKGKKTITYYTKAITKPKLDLKIISYDKIVTSAVPILGKITNIEDYMPDTVNAVMSDSSQQKLLVNWNMKSGSSNKDGSVTYKGAIVGYGNAVTFQSINKSKAPLADNISVINHANAQDDTVIVKGLMPGDIATVYRDAAKTQRLGSQAADATGVATITLTGDNVLPNDSSLVYVTVTTPGIAESDVTETNGIATNEISKPLDSTNEIGITNYAQGGNDTIHIASGTGEAKLQKDDLIKVYTIKNGSRVLLQAQTVKADNTPIEELKNYTCDFVLSGTSSLDEAGGTVYITRTSVTGKESQDLVLSYSAGLAPEVEEYSITSIKDVSGRNVTVTLKDLQQTDTNYAYYYKVISSKPTDLLKYKDRITTDPDTSVTTGWKLYTKGAVIPAKNSDYIYVVKTYNYSGDIRVLNASYRQAIGAVDDTVSGTFAITPQDTVVGGTETINYTLGENFTNGEVKINVPYTISGVLGTPSITGGSIGSVTVSGGVIDIKGISANQGDIISIDIDKPSTAGMYSFVVNSEWNGDAAVKTSLYHPASQAVVVREAAPAGVLDKGTNPGTTMVTGLSANTTYEYVVNSSSTALTQSSADWSTSGKTAISSSAGKIDNITASVGQYVHVRKKSTSTTPASLIQDIGTAVSETISLSAPVANKVTINLAGTRNVSFDNSYIYSSGVVGDTAAVPTIADVSTKANTATIGGNGTITAAISANVISISASGTLLTTAINSANDNNCIYFTVKDGATNADKLVKVVIADKNVGDTVTNSDITSVTVVNPTP